MTDHPNATASWTAYPIRHCGCEWICIGCSACSHRRVQRGTPFDAFGYTEERRSEPAPIEAYFAIVLVLVQTLTPAKLEAACEIAAYSEQIRGYGPVKARNMAAALRRRDDLLTRWRRPGTSTQPKAAA
jgi:indolepyruvate ferredoxin oxidoreductase